MVENSEAVVVISRGTAHRVHVLGEVCDLVNRAFLQKARQKARRFRMLLTNSWKTAFTTYSGIFLHMNTRAPKPPCTFANSILNQTVPLAN